jgi:UPF0176 protein
MEYNVIAYYLIRPVENPLEEVKSHKKFLSNLDARGRIYISEAGVNAQLSVSENDFLLYKNWLEERALYKGVDLKVHKWNDHAFAKLTVKYRKELVAVGIEVDFSQRGEHISPEDWKKEMDAHDKDTIVIDVRNSYEAKVGLFSGAIVPPLDTFREFPEFVEELKKKYDAKKTKVLMYCTGGIRCEFFSPLMKRAGFENVYQLEGGVIQYGLKQGKEHWEGKLFVFDDRLVVPICEENRETISHCIFCNLASDVFYNCANMDCNQLFLACPSCIEGKKGCCSSSCVETGRVRAFVKEARPKPFRKLPFEEKQRLSQEKE